MKHVFLVHSNITELVSRAVLRREAIPAGDALVLCSRGYVPVHAGLCGWPIDYRHNPESFPSSRNFFRAKARLRRFDRDVAARVGGAHFRFYTPQTSQRFMQLFMSHPLCTGFSLIEEGLGSYRTRADVDRAEPPTPRSFWDHVCFGARLRDSHFFAEGQDAAYGVCEDVFPGFADRVILQDALAVSSTSDNEIECVLVLSGLPAYGLLDLASEVRGLERALRDCSALGFSRIHYKYHPALVGSPLIAPYQELFARYAGRFSFVEIAPNIVLEELRPTGRGLTILTNVSSIAIYAARNSCSVLSYARYVAEEEGAFAKTVDQLPEVFHRSVRYLGVSADRASDRSTRVPDPSCAVVCGGF